jgi:hypothetical protein
MAGKSAKRAAVASRNTRSKKSKEDEESSIALVATTKNKGVRNQTSASIIKKKGEIDSCDESLGVIHNESDSDDDDDDGTTLVVATVQLKVSGLVRPTFYIIVFVSINPQIH